MKIIFSKIFFSKLKIEQKILITYKRKKLNEQKKSKMAKLIFFLTTKQIKEFGYALGSNIIKISVHYVKKMSIQYLFNYPVL